MKRFLWMLLLAAFCLSLCACGGGMADTNMPIEREPTLVALSSDEARTAVLQKDTISLGADMPDAAWNDLPVWQGVTIPNLQQYDWNVCEQPQVFSREDVENIAAMGFNFVRVPIDTRLVFDENDPTQVRLDRLQNLDDLISWCAEYGIHLCPDVHFGFGISTDGDESNDTLWSNAEEQDLFVAFWELLAQRYQEVPTNLLSFNLLNEPGHSVTEAQYVALMRRAIEAVRRFTPDRLIFVDMMGVASEPVYGLVEDEVAQSFHFYEPHSFTHAFDGVGTWPAYNCKSTITRTGDTCAFQLSGSLPAGTTIVFKVGSVHGKGSLEVTADQQKLYSWDFGGHAVGQQGCTAIWEEGTGGEYRDYDTVHTITLEQDTEVVRFSTIKDCWWFGLGGLLIDTGTEQYYFNPSEDFSILPAGTEVADFPNPNIVIGEDGSVRDDGDIFFSAMDGAFISQRFAEYKAFTEETGVEVMLQEFGVWYATPYAPTLKYIDALLDAANANHLNWCAWDYFGVFNFYAVNDYEMREGATYEEFSNGWVATELRDVYLAHLTN